MSIRETRLQLLRIAAKPHVSKKELTQAITLHEESVATESGVAIELLKTYVPQLEAQVGALETFVATLHGKYVTDVDPSKTTLKLIRERFEKIDINEIFNKEVFQETQLKDDNREPSIPDAGATTDEK